MRTDPILVTGAAGFVGRRTVLALGDQGYAVVGIDCRPSTGAPVQIDITDPKAVRDVLDCFPRGIIHLAGVSRMSDGEKDPGATIEANIRGTANILEAVRLHGATRKPWVILGSTREVHGDKAQGIYGVTKLCAELLGRRYGEAYGLRVLALRLSDVYGGEDDNPARVLPTFMRQARAGEAIHVDDPNQPHDFTHIDDVAEAMKLGVTWLERQRGGVFKAVPILTGKTTTLEDLAQAAADACASASKIILNTNRKKHKPISAQPDAALQLLGFKAKRALMLGLVELAGQVR